MEVGEKSGKLSRGTVKIIIHGCRLTPKILNPWTLHLTMKKEYFICSSSFQCPFTFKIP